MVLWSAMRSVLTVATHHRKEPHHSLRMRSLLMYIHVIGWGVRRVTRSGPRYRACYGTGSYRIWKNIAMCAPKGEANMVSSRNGYVGRGRQGSIKRVVYHLGQPNCE